MEQQSTQYEPWDFKPPRKPPDWLLAVLWPPVLGAVFFTLLTGLVVWSELGALWPGEIGSGFFSTAAGILPVLLLALIVEHAGFLASAPRALEPVRRMIESTKATAAANPESRSEILRPLEGIASLAMPRSEDMRTYARYMQSQFLWASVVVAFGEACSLYALARDKYDGPLGIAVAVSLCAVTYMLVQGFLRRAGWLAFVASFEISVIPWVASGTTVPRATPRAEDSPC